MEVESVGKILDRLGCVLTAGKNRFAPRPFGQPKKVASVPAPIPSPPLLGGRGRRDAVATDEDGQQPTQAGGTDGLGG